MGDADSLARLHAVLLDMMRWFHALCADHHIPYYMIGGTMLGAARHGGFIPWDDDVDIGVPRADFERLLALAREPGADDRYVLESWRDGNPDFVYPFAKVYDTRTTLIENKRTRPRRGVYIDVFPLDGLPGGTREAALRGFRPLKRELDLLAVVTSGVRPGRAWWKNLAVRAAGVCAPFPGSFARRVRRVEAMCRANRFADAAFVGCLVGVYREREIMPRAYFGEPTLYPFEDAEFYGVARPDEYLSALYGDWRALPPVERRRSGHAYLTLDLDHSYRETP